MGGCLWAHNLPNVPWHKNARNNDNKTWFGFRIGVTHNNTN